MRPSGGERRAVGGAREVRLVRVGDRRGPVLLGESRVVDVRLGSVVLGQQAVDVHAAEPDREAAAAHLDEEAVGRLARDDRRADDVHCLRAQAPVDERDELVPVGVDLHAPLLHQDPGVVAPGVEGHACVVGAHARLLR